MKKVHVYIETSVWSFAFAEDVPEYRADAIVSFDLCRKRLFEPYVSSAVLSEIQFAQAPLRKRLEELVRTVKPVLLPWLPEADDLSDAFVREKAVPPEQTSRCQTRCDCHGPRSRCACVVELQTYREFETRRAFQCHCFARRLSPPPAHCQPQGVDLL